MSNSSPKIPSQALATKLDLLKQVVQHHDEGVVNDVVFAVRVKKLLEDLPNTIEATLTENREALLHQAFKGIHGEAPPVTEEPVDPAAPATEEASAKADAPKAKANK